MELIELLRVDAGNEATGIRNDSEFRRLGPSNLHQRVVPIAAAAEVAEAVGGEGVGEGAGRGVGRPPAEGDGDDARTHAVGETDAQVDGAAVVEDANRVAVGDASGLGVSGVDVEPGFGFSTQMAGQVGVA